MRISTEKQSIDSQKFELLELLEKQQIFIPEENIFIDEISTTRTIDERKQLKELLSILKQFDEVYTFDSDRITRDVGEILALIDQFKRQQIKIFTPFGEFKFTTPEQELFATIKTAFKKYEREFTRIRVKAGLKARKKKGLPLGRPKAITPTKAKKIDKYIEKGINKSSISRLEDISYNTLDRYLNRKGAYKNE